MSAVHFVYHASHNGTGSCAFSCCTVQRMALNSSSPRRLHLVFSQMAVQGADTQVFTTEIIR